MAICPPIIPNSVTGVLETTPILNFAPAYDSVVNRYDPKQIRSLNVLFNAFLQALPPEIINNYPDLGGRFNQGAISDEEFSNILFDQGIVPDVVQDIFERDFPNPIDADLITDYLDNIDDAINNPPVTDDVNITQIDIFTDVFQDSINNQLTNQGPFINTGSNLINDSINIDEIPLDRFIPDVAQINIEEWELSEELGTFLEQANNYYQQNLAVAITENICGGFLNPFAKFSSLIANALAVGDFLKNLGDKVQGFINSITNFSFSSLMRSLTSRLSDLIQKVFDLPKQLQAKFLIKINSLQETATRFINEVKFGSKNLFKYVNKKVLQAKNFLSDLNIENIIARVSALLNLNQLQFEDILPEVLNALLLKVCGITNNISNLLERPVNELKSFIDRMLLNYNITRTESLDHVNNAIKAGAIRISSEKRTEDQERAARTFNERSAGSNSIIEPGRYITVPITEEDRRWKDTITENYSVEFRFSDSVKSMGSVALDVYNNGCPNRPADHGIQWDPKENTPEAGWQRIIELHPEIFIYLRKASARLNAGALTINSAYRSPYYNRIVERECRQNKGAAWDSFHMKGMAIDISTRGLTNEQTALLIKYCSQEGFSRISVYPTFIHCDIVDMGSYRGNWTRNYRGSADIKRAMEIHLADGFRNGPGGVVPID